MNSQRPSDGRRRISSGGSAAAAGLEFQAQLGTLFGLNILSQRPIDNALGLGAAVPLWMQFETDAPVDDILVATSENGFIAIQAKTSVSLSAGATSEFAKTVRQFVRHWLACRNGTGAQLWDRPLDPQRDRLVLAVGPNTSANIRVHLPAALRLRIQPGSPALTRSQQKALTAFEKCAKAAWTDTTTESWTPNIVSELAHVVHVLTFDAYGVDRRSMEMIATAVAASDQLQALFTALSSLCRRWMAERGGADLPGLRRALMQENVALVTPPLFAKDIQALQKHSAEIALALARYESIDGGATAIQITRDCQNAALAAAENGPLLIIGEPGAGKSAVINTLARELRRRGDVVELAVDRYNVIDLDGLRVELGLDNDVVKVLEAWDGSTAGWLIIDALDATRGGRGEGAFRVLIERVLALNGRWRVIASIRTFDLRMGIRFRDLFRGRPPDASYSDPSFPSVRHLLVPPWSPAEFARILFLAPELGQALNSAPAKLQQLAEVPFNTRLINELLQSGVAASTLRNLANQAGLLRLFWAHRIESLGSAAEVCLRHVVKDMVNARILRVQASVAAAGFDPNALDALCANGVLIRVENDRYVQFRHHLLFDYAASRLLLDMDGIVSGGFRFHKSEAKGLMLAPALAFLLQELWASETDRNRYWSAIEQIVGDSQGDPVLRGAAGRLSAELPETAVDTSELARHVESGTAQAISALSHVIAALAVRLEDDARENDPKVPLAPWVALAEKLASNVRRTSLVLRFLVHLLINMAKPPEVSSEIGVAARALLRDAFDHQGPGARTALLIPFVVATFATDPVASRTLLEVIFNPPRFAAHNWEEVPALCREVEKLAQVSPDFVAQIYAKTYAGSVSSDVVTRMGDSQILSFTSTAHQDYGMALYSLSEFFPKFLTTHPKEAVGALVSAAEAYVARAHPTKAGEEPGIITRAIGNLTVRLRPDLSRIWASDPDSQYAQDGPALVAKFTTTLIALPEDAAVLVAEQLASKATSAILWSRLFFAAVRRGDRLIDLLWPIAASEAWLVEPDTRKDAIDVVAAGYAKRTVAEKETLERSAMSFEMSGFNNPSGARQSLLERLFGAIGRDELATEEARSLRALLPAKASNGNERLYSLSTTWGNVDPFDWITDLDQSLLANRNLMDAIQQARTYFGLGSAQSAKSVIETQKGLSALETVARSCAAANLNTELRLFGEGVIGQGCVCLAAGRHLVADAGKLDPAGRFVNLLKIAIQSANPTVDNNTEARFEKSQSWGGPAARVEGAAAALDACLPRPDLYPRLKNDIYRLLDDAHPATRMQAACHLVRLWDIDRPGFWNRLTHRLNLESNFGVLGSLFDLLRRVLHADPNQTWLQLFAVHERFRGTPDEMRLAESTADLMAIQAVTYSLPPAELFLDHWIASPVVFKGSLRKVLTTLREAVVLGLRPGDMGDIKIRHRAQALFHRIVVAVNAPLQSYDSSAELADNQVDALRTCMELLDVAAMELYFATGRASGGTGGLSDEGCATFLKEIAPTIERIGDNASPHTIHHLMQLIEILAPYGAARAFDLTAHVIRAGGLRGGYQHESQGADIVVRLVGTFLADNKELFADETRRHSLVDCLEVFMEAGWASARRLLYRLPELIQ